MKKQLLSFGLAAGLVFGSASTALAQTPAEQAQQALDEFNTFVEQNWSQLGYSSPEAMKAELGNSQTGWLTQTQILAGSFDPAQAEQHGLHVVIPEHAQNYGEFETEEALGNFETGIEDDEAFAQE